MKPGMEGSARLCDFRFCSGISECPVPQPFIKFWAANQDCQIDSALAALLWLAMPTP